MSTNTSTKINHLLSSQPHGIVYTTKWLTKLGYNADLQKRYRKSGWFESIGRGAMIRTGDKVSYQGGVNALQHQLELPIHIGGMTAISIHGLSHFLQLSEKRLELFGSPNTKLPSWWDKYDWGCSTKLYTSSFLPEKMGTISMTHGSFEITISNKARAIMEILLVPKGWGLPTAFQIMLSLNNLRPKVVQELLEKCTSVKVKRLFLYFAELAEHEWFLHLEMSKISLGEGKRSFMKSGVYIKKYKITVPKEIANGI